MVTLVNKYTRDRFGKEEKKQEAAETSAQTNTTDDKIIFQRDEAQEKNVLRVLLEYGLNKWDEERNDCRTHF